jgi:hypothetical protein
MLTAVLALVGVFAVLALVFFVIAPRLMKVGKKKRGPGARR